MDVELITRIVRAVRHPGEDAPLVLRALESSDPQSRPSRLSVFGRHTVCRHDATNAAIGRSLVSAALCPGEIVHRPLEKSRAATIAP